MRFQYVFNVGEAGGWTDELFNKIPPARHRPYMSWYFSGLKVQSKVYDDQGTCGMIMVYDIGREKKGFHFRRNRFRPYTEFAVA